MARARLFDADHGTVSIKCPACNCEHYLNVNPENGRPCWGFNGNYDLPTFTPSILVKSGKYVYEPDNWRTKIPEDRHSDYEQSMEQGIKCHSFVTNGRIKYEGDSTHGMGGQEVDLPEYLG